MRKRLLHHAEKFNVVPLRSAKKAQQISAIKAASVEQQDALLRKAHFHTLRTLAGDRDIDESLREKLEKEMHRRFGTPLLRANQIIYLSTFLALVAVIAVLTFNYSSGKKWDRKNHQVKERKIPEHMTKSDFERKQRRKRVMRHRKVPD